MASYARVSLPDGPAWGRVDGEAIRLIDGSPLAGRVRETGAWVPVAGARLLAPCEPTKIVCLGMNYASHAREIGLPIPDDPAMFMKPVSALAGHGDAIVLPARSDRVEHEAELAFVIGRRAHRIRPEEALSHVFGYTCANDVTARDIQTRGGNYLNVVWSKAYETFCPVGPVLVAGDIDPDDVLVECRVNGALRQSESTRDFIFPVATQIAWISQIMPLEVGDLVLTGTPKGVGRLVAGDVVEISISGIGTLSNPVRS